MGVMKRLMGWMRRLDVAAGLMAAALVLMAIGSLFPQLPREVKADPAALARWQAAVRRRYGERIGVYEAVRGFTLGRSPLTWAPLGLLVLATAACSVPRLARTGQQSRRRDVISDDATMRTAPYRRYIRALGAPGSSPAHPAPGVEGPSPSGDAIWKSRLRRSPGMGPSDRSPGVEGSSPSQTVSALAAIIAARRYRVHRASHDGTHWLMAERRPLSRLASPLLHLAVLLIALGAATTSLAAQRIELTLAPGETAPLGAGGTLTLRYDGFEIPRGTGGRPLDYVGEVALVAESGDIVAGRLSMNRPLIHRGWHITLRDYWGASGEERLVLLASRDPGFAPLILGGALLTAAMFVALYGPAASLRARLTPDGELLLAAWPGRHAWGFDAEWAGLVAEALEIARAGAKGEVSP